MRFWGSDLFSAMGLCLKGPWSCSAAQSITTVSLRARILPHWLEVDFLEYLLKETHHLAIYRVQGSLLSIFLGYVIPPS